ncbi:MAG: ATP-binding protein [Lachnospiraceae bacterium]
MKIKLRKPRISLGIVMFIIIMIGGALPSTMIYVGFLQNYEENAVAVNAATVQTQLKVVANHLVTYDYLNDIDSDMINAELEMISNLYDGRVLIISSNYKIIKDTFNISQGKYMISEEVMKCFQGVGQVQYEQVDGYIEITTPITQTVLVEENGVSAEQEVVIGVMLTSISNDSIMDVLEVVREKAVSIFFICMLVLIVIAYTFSIMVVSPLKKLTSYINEVKAGFLDEIVPINGYVETAQITDSFNQLMGRMKVLDDSRQEFVANVSHELKTPLASIKVLADSLTSMPDAPIELYQEFFADITVEIDRENQIITDLLSLVKFDKKVAALNISEVDIDEMLELVLNRLKPLARKKDITLILESKRSAIAEVDAVKMNLVFMNLIENAIKYNEDQGTVTVILDADYQQFIVKIIDTGIGIPEEDWDFVYERFYRVDKSHSREIGGTGLGLAITKAAIIMHRGSIDMTSVMGIGTTFEVKIPLKSQVQQTRV